MGRTPRLSFSFLTKVSFRRFSMCLYACIYLALAGQSSCSGTGTKTFGNAPGSNSSTTSGSSNAVSSASFDGLVSVSSIDYRSVSLAYGKSVDAVSLNIYCTVGKNATTYTLVGNLPNILAAGGSGTLSGISSGTTHTCYALPVNAAGVETPLVVNATPITVSFQTLSYLQNTYRNVAIVKAYGDTVNPVTSPTNRMVSITWVPISDSTLSGMTYRVFRTLKGVTPNLDDAGAGTNCIAAQSGSSTCRVNCASGSNLGMMGSALTCIDTSVATAPARYWYFISLVPSSTPGTLHYEEPPSPPSTLTSVTPAVSSDAYFVDVPIPPDEMVLVHRDSVNYEFCQLIGRGSTDLAYIDGRVTPTGAAIPGRGVLYDNRCLFGNSRGSAPGALPYNSNAYGSPITFQNAADGKGYYDFGYNLFIDRWELGCNWSPASGTTLPDGSVGTGMCSTGAATPQGCFGGAKVGNFNNNMQSILDGTNILSTTPANTIGSPGNVYWDATQMGSCYVKDGSTWRNTGFDPTISSSVLSQAFTNKPYNHLTQSSKHFIKPPAMFGTQTTASRACQSQVASGYNRTKRIMRRREFVAASAWPSSIDIYNPEKLPPTTLNRISTNSNSSLLPRTISGSCHNPLQSPSAWSAWSTNERQNFGDTTTGTGPREAPSIYFGFNLLPTPTPQPSSSAYFATANSSGFGVGPLVIGSPWTTSCVSRYGAQDLIGNVGEWSSDQYTCSGSGAAYTCTAVQRSQNFYDDGADQQLNFDDNSAPKPVPTTNHGLFIGYLTTQSLDYVSSAIPFGWAASNWAMTYFSYLTPISGSLSCPAGTPKECGQSLSQFHHWFWQNATAAPESLNQLNGIHYGLGFPTPKNATSGMTACDSAGVCPITTAVSNIDPQLRGFSMDASTSGGMTALAPINGGANLGGRYRNGSSSSWTTDLINSTTFQYNPSRYNVQMYATEGSRTPSSIFLPNVPMEASQAPFLGARCAFSPD